ncbi:MAG TPA: DUF3224 domain-containing protein [Flavobacteriales bacterium]
MPTTIKGLFDIRSTPHPASDMAEGLDVGRITFHKTFHGPLEGQSVVEMLGMMDQKLMSGAYVALERFIGSVDGRRGTFALQHSSTMDRGTPTQRISVVPDSGTGELQGIRGTMVIDIIDKQHHYTFEYAG